MRQERPERMAAAGSLTPALEGAARTLSHTPRGGAGAPTPKQEKPSGGDAS